MIVDEDARSISSARRESLLAWGALAFAMVVAAGLRFWFARDITFVYDELLWLPLSHGSAGDLIQPYGGHLIVVLLLITRFGQGIFGLSTTGFGVLAVAVVLGVGALFFEYSRRRVRPIVALGPSILVLFLGFLLLEPLLGVEYAAALLLGIGALLALERSDRSGDIAACVLLCLAAAELSYGVAFLAGAAVSVALRPDRRRRAWIVLVPLLAYIGWRIWATQFPAGAYQPNPSNVAAIPAYALDSLAATVTSMFGVGSLVGLGPLTGMWLDGIEPGRLAGGVALICMDALVVVLGWRWLRARGPLPATFWVALAVLGAVWIAQGLALSDTRRPGEDRYVYLTAVVLLLVAVEAVRGIRASRFAAGVVLAAAALAVAGTVVSISHNRDALLEYTAREKPSFELLQRYGVRSGSDRLWSSAAHLEPATGTSPEDCRQVGGQAGGAVLAELPRRGVLLRSARPSPVELRRFAGHFSFSIGRLRRGALTALRITEDPVTVPWRLRAPTAGRMVICSLD